MSQLTSEFQTTEGPSRQPTIRNEDTNEHEFEVLELSEAGLRAHAGMRKEAMWDDQDVRFLALCEDVRENGVRIPIPITRKREIVDYDGIERWKAARVLAHGHNLRIPVVYVPDDQAVTAILGSLFQRKSFTKSARAYLAYPILEEAMMEAKRRRVAWLKSAKTPMISRSSSEKTIPSNTVETLAYALGLGRNLLFQAQQVHERFEQDPEFKELMEPRILAEPIGGEHEDLRPVGLGAVLAGWAGRKETKDEARGQIQLCLRFRKCLDGLKHWASHWDKFEGQDREKARESVKETVAEMPATLREEFAKAIRKVNQEQS